MKPYKIDLRIVNEEHDLKTGVHSILLDEKIMMKIHHYYEVQCTAEYVADNYPHLTEEEAEEVALEARRKMNEYGYYEEEAVEITINEMNFERGDDQYG